MHPILLNTFKSPPLKQLNMRKWNSLQWNYPATRVELPSSSSSLSSSTYSLLSSLPFFPWLLRSPVFNGWDGLRSQSQMTFSNLLWFHAIFSSMSLGMFWSFLSPHPSPIIATPHLSVLSFRQLFLYGFVLSHDFNYHLYSWFSTLQILWPLDTVPHVIVIPIHKIISLLLLKCNFDTVVHCNVNTWFVGYLTQRPQVENCWAVYSDDWRRCLYSSLFKWYAGSYVRLEKFLLLYEEVGKTQNALTTPHWFLFWKSLIFGKKTK